jgi:putative chitinase
MITVAQLITAGISPTQAKIFAEPLDAACRQFGIDRPQRIAMFIAQAAHESVGFSQLEENLRYRDPMRIAKVWPSHFSGYAAAAAYMNQPQALANHVYAHRNGNGDEASGDGWRYRGRGLFQLTGRANYAAAGEALQQPLVEAPELVALPQHAALTAAWFWSARNLNGLADLGDVAKITRAINGPAMLGLVERREAFTEAMQAFA